MLKGAKGAKEKGEQIKRFYKEIYFSLRMTQIGIMIRLDDRKQAAYCRYLMMWLTASHLGRCLFNPFDHGVDDRKEYNLCAVSF